ncbi:diguanylate cyclase domain-containing protein [Lysobacter korlensis]|uniref:Diguanylate cyclase domain-containing protein n=1 Tax=Lysobacter korlensis TaxID=553636 RepID=A0ABV6RTZ6_9GAMM
MQSWIVLRRGSRGNSRGRAKSVRTMDIGRVMHRRARIIGHGSVDAGGLRVTVQLRSETAGRSRRMCESAGAPVPGRVTWSRKWTIAPARPSPPEPGHQFAAMVDRVRDYAIFLIDPEGRIASWNPAAEAMKGYSAAEIIGQPLDVLYTDAQRKAGAPQHNLRAAREEGTYVEESWRRRKDGQLFWALIEIISIVEPGGVHTGFCKITRDLTHRKRLHDALEQEMERTAGTLQAIGDAVVSTDAEGRISFANAKAQSLSGRSLNDLFDVGIHELLVFGDGETPPLAVLFEQLCQGQVFSEHFPVLLRKHDGSTMAVDGVAAPVRALDGRFAGCVVVFRDATTSRENLRALAHQATHDDMTGLVNRAEFDKRLARSVMRAQQSATASALIYIDLDGFKAVNDSGGHAAGDELLRRLARIFAEHIRERDTLARIGGDEFALIIDGCSHEVADRVADAIRSATEDFAINQDGREYQVGASVGVTLIVAGDTAEEALGRADRACYTAKAQGGNRVHHPRMH